MPADNTTPMCNVCLIQHQNQPASQHEKYTMKNRLMCLTSLVFCATICTPFVLWLAQVDIKPVPVLENRTLAPRPELGKIPAEQWAQKIEDWVSDHMPLRTQAISLYLKLWEWHLHTPVRSVLRGSNGHLFTIKNVKLFTHITPVPSKHRYKLRALFAGRQAWFEERGIKYLLVLMPTKETMLYNHLPKWAQPLHNEALIDRIAALLKTSNIKFISFADVYRNTKIDLSDLYFKKNDPEHYNERGFYLAHDIVQKWMNHNVPNTVEIPSLGSLDFKNEIIAVGPFGTEIIPRLQYSVPKETTVYTIGELQDYKIKDDLWLAPAKVSNSAGKNNVVAATDSFFARGGWVYGQSKKRPMLPLCLQAKQAIAFHYESFSYDAMNLIFQKFKPDVVLEEHAEVQLQYATNRRQPIEVVILGEKKLGNLQIAITPNSFSGNNERVNFEILSAKDDRVTIKTKSNYNYIRFNEKIKTNNEGYAVVIANINTPIDTVSHIFYRIPGKTWLTTSLFTRKGDGLLYFQIIGVPNTEYEVRFSPGFTATEYTLKDIPFLNDIK